MNGHDASAPLNIGTPKIINVSSNNFTPIQIQSRCYSMPTTRNSQKTVFTCIAMDDGQFDGINSTQHIQHH